MCSVLNTDDLVLSVGCHGDTRQASIRREVFVNIDCFFLVMRHRREGMVMIRILKY